MMRAMRTLGGVVLVALSSFACSPTASESSEITGGEEGADASAPIRFAVLGDSGTGTAGQYAVAESLEATCAADGCDFVLMLGDNIYNSGAESVVDPIWQERFEEPYADIDLPFYPVLGNHDYGGEIFGFDYGGLGNEFERGPIEVEYSQYSDKWRMPDTHYVLRFGPVGIVMLDTNSILWDNEDHGDQWEWWQGALAEASLDATWVLAAGHHPFRSNGSHGNAGAYGSLEGLEIQVPIDAIDGDEVEDFMEELVCGAVDVYMAGHDHNRQWLDESDRCGGTELLVNGASGKVKDLKDRGNAVRWQDDSLAGFLYVVVDGPRFTGRFIDENGNVDFEYTLEK
jgi:tartrate-resistant acid phosphatase type 5